MLLVARRFGARVYNQAQLVCLAEEDDEFTDDDIRSVLNDLRSWADEYSIFNNYALDRTAKNKEFVIFVLDKAFAN